MASGLENIETIESTFRRFVTTIGVFPTAFTDAMTYYECLAYLVKYLEDTVIPAVNENAEALEELQKYYIQLKSYVENYFANLDVQDEINNKLDEMAEAGTLQEIITAYIQSNVAWTFDTVADMKSATNLVAGSYAQTLGFHSLNDDGGATYYISDSGTANEMDTIAVSDLYAHLVEGKNVKQFGAYGDGTHDDTTAIQTAITAGSMFVPNGTYMVDAETSIVMPSNRNLILDKNAVIKAITNAVQTYKIIKIDNVSNIHIEGGTIQGERDTHSGVGGEWGMGISIMNGASDITIKNITLKNCWGDGLYINGGINIRTENLICDNNRRQGLSITKVTGFRSLNDKFINTNGTQPYSGVDLEPNNLTDEIEDVVFDNPTTGGNDGRGILIWLHNTVNNSIIINNHHDTGSKYGLGIGKDENVKGQIIINDPVYIDSKESGIQLNNLFNSACQVIINRPYIENCNTTGNTASYTAGISCYTTDDVEVPLGGFTIVEPYITMKEKVASARCFYARDNENNINPINITIINPRNHQSNLRINVGDGIENFIFTDINHLYGYESDGNLSIANSNIYSSFDNKNTTTARTLTLGTGLSIGNELTFICSNNSYNMNVQFPTDQYCKFFDENNAAPRIRMPKQGIVTVKKISSTDWMVSSIVGEPTLV